MENTDHKHSDDSIQRHVEDPNKPHKPIEHDYTHHQADPGPSPQAVNEKDINGASAILRWLIPLLVVALLIYWLVYK